jgi:hypothetical protein
MWHDELYLNDPSTDNIFGREALAPRRNAMLLEFLRHGGRLADFPRNEYSVNGALKKPG